MELSYEETFASRLVFEERRGFLYPHWVTRGQEFVVDAHGFRNLSWLGRGKLYPLDRSQMLTCVKFIAENCQHEIDIQPRSSYVWKHIVEKWERPYVRRASYVSNGAFLWAALELEYRVEVTTPNGLFAMGFKYPRGWSHVST